MSMSHKFIANTGSPVNLTALNCGRMPVHSTQKHSSCLKDSNKEPSYCDLMVLTTAPPCQPFMLPFKVLLITTLNVVSNLCSMQVRHCLKRLCTRSQPFCMCVLLCPAGIAVVCVCVFGSMLLVSM